MRSRTSLHHVSTRIPHHARSICDQRRENRGEVGRSWWLLWSPSPQVKSASNQPFVAELSLGRRPHGVPDRVHGAAQPEVADHVHGRGEDAEQDPPPPEQERERDAQQRDADSEAEAGVVEHEPVEAIGREVARVLADGDAVARDAAGTSPRS